MRVRKCYDEMMLIIVGHKKIVKRLHAIAFPSPDLPSVCQEHKVNKVVNKGFLTLLWLDSHKKKVKFAAVLFFKFSV